MEAAPPSLIMAGVTDRAAADAAIARLLDVADAPTFTESQHAGVTIRSTDEDNGGAYALTDDQLIVGTDADTVATAIDAHAAPGDSLAGADTERRSLRHCPTTGSRS